MEGRAERKAKKKQEQVIFPWSARETANTAREKKRKKEHEEERKRKYVLCVFCSRFFLFSPANDGFSFFAYLVPEERLPVRAIAVQLDRAHGVLQAHDGLLASISA